MDEMLEVGTIAVRAMRIGDLDRVIAIADGLLGAPHWPRPAYEALFAPGSERLGLVAEAEVLVIGFAVVRVMAPEAELESIAVVGEVQSRGVGGLLMEAAIQELRTAGIAMLSLEVRVSNAAALALYGRLGFLESGRRRAYYSGPREDAVLMQLALS